MLPYAIITKLSSDLFEDFGLNEKDIRAGRIPSEQDFTDAVKNRYNEIHKPFKGKSVDEFYDSDAWKDFQKNVRNLYKEIKQVAVGEAPAKAIDVRLEQIAGQIAVIKGLIKARKEMLTSIQNNREEAAKIVEEALEETKMPLKKWDVPKKPSQPLERKKQSPYRFASAPAGDPSPGAKVHVPKEMSENTKKLQEDLKSALVDLRSGDKSSQTYAKSIAKVMNVIQKSVEDLTHSLNELNREGVSLINRKKEPGKKTITVKTPPKLEPLSDVGDIPVWHEFMGKPESKEETKEVDVKHRNVWLTKPAVIESLLREIHKEPEPDQFTTKEDIGEDFLTDMQHMVQALWKVRTDINRKFFRRENGLGKDDTMGLLKGIEPSTHSLLSIPEDVFNSYKNFLSTLSSKISREDYKKLMDLNSSGEYVTDTADLPDNLKPYREKLQIFRDEIRGLIKDNTEEFDRKWGDLVSFFTSLRKNFADIRKTYNVLKKDRYFKTWLSGKPGAPFKEAAVKHKDTSVMFKKVLEELHGFKDFVFDSPVLKNNSFSEFRDALKDGDDLNDFITGLGESVEDAYKALIGYRDDLHSYLENVMSGRVVDIAKLYPDEAEKKSYVCISEAFRLSSAELMGRDRTFAPYVATYHLRRMAEKWFREAKVEKSPSEYEIGLPLQFLRTGPEGAPLKGPQGFSFHEFFQHSFPIEEFLNEWVERSGGTKLDPSKLKGLLKDMDKYVTRMVEKQYSKGELEKEHEKAQRVFEANERELQQRAQENAELIGKAHNVMDKVNDSLKDQRDFSNEAKKHLKETVQGFKDLLQSSKEMARSSAEEEPPEGYTKEEWEKALKEREKASPARRPSEPIKTKKIEPKQEKEVEKEAPVQVKKMLKMPEKMHYLFNHIMDVASEAKTITNPMTGKKEDYETFKEKISRLWSGIEEKVIKNTNRISELQKKNFMIQRKRNELEDWIKNGVDPEFIEESKAHFVPYLWNVIDEDWQGKGKIREFQTRFPAGLIEYFQVKEELEKMVGHRLNSRVVNRVRESLKQQIRWLRDRGMNIENAKEFLKQIGKDFRVLDEYYRKPEESVKEILDLAGMKIPTTKELEPAKTALWDYPTQMSYRVAMRSLNIEPCEDLKALIGV